MNTACFLCVLFLCCVWFYSTMKFVHVFVVCAAVALVLCGSVSAEEVDAARPKAAKAASVKKPVTVLKPRHFMPKSRGTCAAAAVELARALRPLTRRLCFVVLCSDCGAEG